MTIASILVRTWILRFVLRTQVYRYEILHYEITNSELILSILDIMISDEAYDTEQVFHIDRLFTLQRPVDMRATYTVLPPTTPKDINGLI